MEKKEKNWRGHVLVLPFPVQGHINPMLQFSKLLVSKGLKVTLATTLFITKSMNAHTQTQTQSRSSPVKLESFSDGCDESGMAEPESFKAYLERFKTIGSRSLAELIKKHDSSGGYPIKCLVYDSVLPWALDLAKRLGLTGASFFTQSCAVDAIFYYVHQGLLSTPVQGPTVSIPGLPLLGIHDLPSQILAWELDPTSLGLVLNQFSNIDKADWLLFNTFEKLEGEVVSWMAKLWPIKTIGPTVPSMYLDKRIEDDKEYGLDLFKLNGDTYIKWLNTKEMGSVVYVSFGSIVMLGEDQMHEIAWGLKGSDCYYLWVVRESEERKVPIDFIEKTSHKGLVVTWCPQLEVLAHQAVGCFITHCGWNSTIEALSLGVPMVGMPNSSDQTTNAKFIENMWEVGIKARRDEKGLVRREEIELCIKEVMHGERRQDIKRNANRLKDLAKEAVNEGGSSDKNIEEFVARFVC